MTALHFVHRAIGLAVIVALFAILFALTAYGQQKEQELGLGGLFRLRGPRPEPPSVAVVAIDRTSALALGQSEKTTAWPRALHARLIDALASAGARVIAFDVSFADDRGDPEGDRTLAAAIRRAGNVVLLDLLDERDAGSDRISIRQHLPPLPAFRDAAAAHGPFLLPKGNSVHAYWVHTPGPNPTPSMPVLAYEVYRRSGGAAREPGVAARDDARYLDFYGPPRTVRTVAFHQVLQATDQGTAGAAWLRATFSGRAVFVGHSPKHRSEQDRVRDGYRTVYSLADGLDLSGVEIAATAFANLVEGRAPRPLTAASGLWLLLGWALVLGAVGAGVHGRRAMPVFAAVGLAYLTTAHACFVADARWLPLVGPLLVQLPLATLGGLLLHFITERRRLGAVIGDLLPEVVVANLVRRIHQVAPGKRTEFGVFIMTDVQGFTSISEELSPTEAADLLNDYFALTFPPVERHGGSVSQIDGDGMLAFWLAKGPDATVRRSACLAALEIATLTAAASALPGRPELPTRIGVHGGPITLARIGASRHHEYRAVGDACNTASRIEALSKHLGTRLLASEDTVASLDDELLTRPVGAFMLAGKVAAVRIHEIIARRCNASAAQLALCASFPAILEAYQSQRWHDAAALCRDILQSFPEDGPTLFYLQLATQHTLEPPPLPWDAVVRMATK